MAKIIARHLDNAVVAMCMDTKLNDELGIQAWGEELYALVENAKVDRVVVNFQQVTFMSSSALRVLITLNNKAKVNGVKLGLCGINSNIMEAFKITRLNTMFTIKPSENEAIKALK